MDAAYGSRIQERDKTKTGLRGIFGNIIGIHGFGLVVLQIEGFLFGEYLGVTLIPIGILYHIDYRRIVNVANTAPQVGVLAVGVFLFEITRRHFRIGDPGGTFTADDAGSGHCRLQIQIDVSIELSEVFIIIRLVFVKGKIIQKFANKRKDAANGTTHSSTSRLRPTGNRFHEIRIH